MTQNIENLIKIDMENEKEVRNFIDSFEIPMVKVEIPQIFGTKVSDYHDLRSIQQEIKESIGLDYEYEEITGSRYEGIFWMKGTPKPIDYIKAIQQTYKFDS